MGKFWKTIARAYNEDIEEECRLRDIVKNYKISYQASKFNTLSSVLLTLVTPFLPYCELIFITFLINHLQQGARIPFLLLFVSAVAFYILKGTIESWDLFILNSRFKINKLFRELLWQKAYEMDFTYFVETNRKKRYIRAQDAINKGFLGPAGTIYQMKLLLEHFVLAIALMIFSCTIDYRLGVILIINGVVSYYFVRQINRVETQKQTEQTEKRLEVKTFENYITDIAYAKEIRIFQLGQIFLNRIHTLYQALKNINETYTNKTYRSHLLIEGVNIVSFVCNLMIIVHLLLQGHVLIGTVVLFVGLQFNFLNIFVSMIESMKKLKILRLFSRSYYEFIEAVDDEQERQNHEANQTVDTFKTLEFQHVSYRYEDSPHHYVLKDVSFQIQAGQKICLVGVNGSGKSTILRLIQGLVKPTTGTILINGIDISKIKRSCLVSMMFTIFQENVLYALSLRENLDPQYTYDTHTVVEQLAAHKLIEAADDIESIQVTQYFSETGKIFSGGEVQKLKYIKAVLAQSDVVLLDEPTSAMDLQSEKEFFTAIFSEFSDRTAILITHNIYMAQYFDHIIVIEHGELVGEGHFEMLQQTNENFKTLLRGGAI